MKKAFDQTVRDLKRGVNKTVLKVPSIEQKVLDATSNEPWGPHGTLLADIAQASRNYHEYQMTMSILWKRLNDTGKNWRHVYKALTVLEYMVAHGSERVIEEIREHAYQIKTLADFQYIDSSGRDQGNNVRKKSQNLVTLVNDTERIQEVRQKAAANRDKFQNSSAGSMYRPGSHSSSGGYGDRYDDRYGSRDGERNGYGRDDDRYGRYGDPYSRDGDRYSGDDEDRYGRDDNYRGRSHSVDGSQNGSRSRSADRDGDRSYEDDGQKIPRVYSEQNLSAPPSYEEAAGSDRSPNHSDRNEETSAGPPKSSPPPASRSLPQTTATSPTPSSSAAPAVNKEAQTFDEFDPRGSFPGNVKPTMSGNGEMDLLASFTDNSLALVPTTSFSSTTEVDTSTNFASVNPSQGFDDPFGDGPFKAIAPTDAPGQQKTSHYVPSSQNPSNSGPELPQQVPQNLAVATFAGETSTSSGDPNIDILADILPQAHQTGFPAQFGQTTSPPNQPVPQPDFSQSGPVTHQTSFPVQSQYPSSLNGFPAQSGQLVMHPNFSSQFGQPAHQASFPAHNLQPSSMAGYPNQSAQASLGQSIHPNAVPYGNYNMQSGGQNMAPEVSSAPISQQNSTNFLAPPQQFQAPQATVATAPPTKDKFETKSTVWTDTLSRGLVNLNISGAKTNPLSDIGVDFDALNRKEKRMEKPTATPMTSTIHMGKAMGSGSGIGRAGAGMGMGMGMGMAGPRPGVGMSSYGAVNQQPMNMAPNMGMGMNMGMGAQMQRPMGFPPGSAMPGGYNPMTGTGNYGQNPYGGGYR